MKSTTAAPNTLRGTVAPLYPITIVVSYQVNLSVSRKSSILARGYSTANNIGELRNLSDIAARLATIKDGRRKSHRRAATWNLTECYFRSNAARLRVQKRPRHDPADASHSRMSPPSDRSTPGVSSPPEIAARLVVGMETAIAHVSRIPGKSGLRDRTQAVVVGL
ncbi:hypothetical protein [Catellatospora sichuanensis]|uniref:hypothetical protein n=1 Tax=Catellatospora sichuanensis TaxID=1969805 RepID=UPI0016423918|nr:hypothetical protein [Catellatospora sichuanensis]